jgi:hypothetical protein
LNVNNGFTVDAGDAAVSVENLQRLKSRADDAADVKTGGGDVRVENQRRLKSRAVDSVDIDADAAGICMKKYRRSVMSCFEGALPFHQFAV